MCIVLLLRRINKWMNCGFESIEWEEHVTWWTRNTQRAQTFAERQHNRILTAEWFLQCKLAMQLWSESTRYFFDNPVNPDFGLRTHGSGRWSGSSPKCIPLVPGPCPTPPKMSSKSVHNFFSYPTDRQTDRSENITSFFGGGNYSWVSWTRQWQRHLEATLHWAEQKYQTATVQQCGDDMTIMPVMKMVKLSNSWPFINY